MVILFMIRRTTFHQKLQSIQYNAALTLTGAIRGSFSGNVYLELGLDFLQMRQ